MKKSLFLLLSLSFISFVKSEWVVDEIKLSEIENRLLFVSKVSSSRRAAIKRIKGLIYQIETTALMTFCKEPVLKELKDLKTKLFTAKEEEVLALVENTISEIKKYQIIYKRVSLKEASYEWSKHSMFKNE
jgi:hypothetical protein